MEDNEALRTRILPEKIDVYVIAADGSISPGVGISPDVFIDEHSSGRLFEKDTALYIRANYGKVVGVMRDSKYSAGPKQYGTRKMILGVTTPRRT